MCDGGSRADPGRAAAPIRRSVCAGRISFQRILPGVWTGGSDSGGHVPGSRGGAGRRSRRPLGPAAKWRRRSIRGAGQPRVCRRRPAHSRNGHSHRRWFGSSPPRPHRGRDRSPLENCRAWLLRRSRRDRTHVARRLAAHGRCRLHRRRRPLRDRPQERADRQRRAEPHSVGPRRDCRRRRRRAGGRSGRSRAVVRAAADRARVCGCRDGLGARPARGPLRADSRRPQSTRRAAGPHRPRGTALAAADDQRQAPAGSAEDAIAQLAPAR
jgi:hypothetical protein